MRISVGMLGAIPHSFSANTKVHHLCFRVMFPKMYTPPDIMPNPSENTVWLSIPQCSFTHEPLTVCQVCQSLKISGWGWWSLFSEGRRWPLVSKKSAAYCGSRTAVTSGILLPQSRKWWPCCLLAFTLEEVHSSTLGWDNALTQQDSFALRDSHSSMTDTYPKQQLHPCRNLLDSRKSLQWSFHSHEMIICHQKVFHEKLSYEEPVVPSIWRVDCGNLFLCGLKWGRGSIHIILLVPYSLFLSLLFVLSVYNCLCSPAVWVVKEGQRWRCAKMASLLKHDVHSHCHELWVLPKLLSNQNQLWPA